MRKLIAVILSVTALYAVTLIPVSEKEASEKRTMSYEGINYSALSALESEVLAMPNVSESIKNNLKAISENKETIYITHAQETNPAPYSVWIYLAGLIIGIFGFASFQKEKEVSSNVFSGHFHDVDLSYLNEEVINPDFKSLNQLVAENTESMNNLFQASAKIIDVDFNENLSECFIETDRLNEAVREFMLANFNLIKDQAQVGGLFLRTSENGQRFNLNCYIPALNKESFASTGTSQVFIQKLSSLESKLNPYQPRVSFRWIATGETHGVDICLSLENKSELELTLKETTT